MMRLLKLLRRLRIKWFWLAAAVLAGVFVHIATVLAVTQFGSHRGIAAVAQIPQINSMVVLPLVAAGHQLLPFMSPSTRYAVCRFDLRKGPVVIHATLGSDSWTVALYSATGANVYAVSGADLQQRDVELLLSATQDSQGASLPITRDAAATTITVGMPTHTGVAMISAPMASMAEGNTAARLLTLAVCNARPRTN